MDFVDAVDKVEKESNLKSEKPTRQRRGSPISNSIKVPSKGGNEGRKISGITELDEFLNNKIIESEQIKYPWNKLSRQDKNKLLSNFASTYSKNNNLSEAEEKVLSSYLVDAMGHNRTLKVKELVYDKENKVIISIPILVYTPSKEMNKRFTLKRTDSTLKSVTPRKGRKVAKVRSIGIMKNSDSTEVTPNKDADADADLP